MLAGNYVGFVLLYAGTEITGYQDIDFDFGFYFAFEFHYSMEIVCTTLKYGLIRKGRTL